MPHPLEQARVALEALYARVASDLAARPSLRCEMSGRCCRFREAGHALFLTGLEYAAMVAAGGPPSGPGEEVCPWLENGLCANRNGRALACRTYHCSNESEAAEVTERWHGEIRQLHERLGLPYAYGRLADFVNSARPATSDGEVP